MRRKIFVYIILRLNLVVIYKHIPFYDLCIFYYFNDKQKEQRIRDNKLWGSLVLVYVYCLLMFLSILSNEETNSVTVVLDRNLKYVWIIRLLVLRYICDKSGLIFKVLTTLYFFPVCQSSLTLNYILPINSSVDNVSECSIGHIFLGVITDHVLEYPAHCNAIKYHTYVVNNLFSQHCKESWNSVSL